MMRIRERMEANQDLSPTITFDNGPQENPLVLLVGLFMSEGALLVMAVAMYVKGDRPMGVFLSLQPGRALLWAIALFVVAAAVIIRQYAAARRAQSRQFRLVAAMNLIMVLLVILTCEVVVRLGTNGSKEGERWRSRMLVPKRWEKVALTNRKLVEQGADYQSFRVYDDVMGWTVGPNRRSDHGLYCSSSEGIRAAHENMSFAKTTEKTRIALVGDSFTFGDNVTYEDSWGYLLEKALGADFEVLNFGVSGYGVDQAYMRYQKDVRQWNPQVVILGFISDDVERTMVLYHSLSGWWDIPFSKPRFILQNGELKPLNVPPLRPEALFSRSSVSDLPFLEYDRRYRSSDWQSSLFHLSYFARAIMTMFPSWEPVRSDVSDAALVSVNVAILRAFAQSATSQGSIPLVVYFPEKNAELDEPRYSLPLGKKVLQEAGMAYTDLSPCLRPVSPAERFIHDRFHYSPQSNATIAGCLVKVVQEALTSSSPGARKLPSPKQ